MMNERFDTDGLLQAESRAWAELRKRFLSLTDAQMTTPGVTGDWSPRELLIHIACWHRWMADKLNSYASGFGKVEPFTDEAVNAMNAEFVTRFEGWPVSAVLELSRDAHTRGVVSIRGSSFRGFDETWERVIRENTTDHYDEHLAELDKFIAGLG